jgi:hypothetical protein
MAGTPDAIKVPVSASSATSKHPSVDGAPTAGVLGQSGQYQHRAVLSFVSPRPMALDDLYDEIKECLPSVVSGFIVGLSGRGLGELSAPGEKSPASTHSSHDDT